MGNAASTVEDGGVEVGGANHGANSGGVRTV